MIKRIIATIITIAVFIMAIILTIDTKIKEQSATMESIPSEQVGEITFPKNDYCLKENAERIVIENSYHPDIYFIFDISDDGWTEPVL